MRDASAPMRDASVSERGVSAHVPHELASDVSAPAPGRPDPTSDAADTWPDWVVVDVGERLEGLRQMLEARAAASSAVGADARERTVTRPPTPPKAAARLAGPDDRPSGFDLMSRLFELSPFEEDVLALALAREVDPSFGDLFAAAHGDPRRPYPTADLALDLFAGSLADRLVARRSFLQGSPLVRNRLIRLEDPGSPGATAADRVLRLEPRITDLLLGLNRPDEDVRAGLERIEAGSLSSAEQAMVDALERSLRPLLTSHPRPVLNLVGPVGSGRHVLAEAVSTRLGLELYQLDVAALPEDPAERRYRLRAIDRDAIVSAAALYVDATVPPERLGVLADILRERESFVVAGSATPLTISGAETLAVEVPLPDATATIERWSAVLGDHFPTGEDALDLAEQFAFGPRTIQRAAAAALRDAGIRDRALTTADLIRAARRQASSDLDELARRLEPRYDWDDIVLPADLTAQLHEIAGQVGHRVPGLRGVGFRHASLARGRGITALFAGPSGTGKTMAAEILARDLGLDLYRIDLAGVVSKYIGETEKNLRRVFDAAERSGSILLLRRGRRAVRQADRGPRQPRPLREHRDQLPAPADGGLPRAGHPRHEPAEPARPRLPPPPAVHPRLPVPRPRQPPRHLGARLPAGGRSRRLDADALSRLEVAGGNIRSIAVNAAFLAAEEGSPDQDEPRHACRPARVHEDRQARRRVRVPAQARSRGMNRRTVRIDTLRVSALDAPAARALPGTFEAALRRAIERTPLGVDREPASGAGVSLIRMDVDATTGTDADAIAAAVVKAIGRAERGGQR